MEGWEVFKDAMREEEEDWPYLACWEMTGNLRTGRRSSMLEESKKDRPYLALSRDA